MVFKKVMQSDRAIILNSSLALKDQFQPGFRYLLGGVTYTVMKDVSQDPTAQLRSVLTSSGDTEILSCETILKDLKQKDCVVMDPDPRFAKKEAKKNESEETDDGD